MKKYIITLSILTFISNAATETSFSKTFEKKIKLDTLATPIQDEQKVQVDANITVVCR